jgi:alcohol dehydrogenase (cytochrome c)
MYVIAPGGAVQALDGTNGDLIWEYSRNYPSDMAQTIRSPNLSRSKNLAIFQDMVYFAAPDGYLVALDARNGTVRWQTKAHDYKDGTEHTGGLMVADGKLLSNRACKVRAGCFIAAHDAKSGEELWKFYNTPAPGGRAAKAGAIFRPRSVRPRLGACQVRMIRSARSSTGRSPTQPPTRA